MSVSRVLVTRLTMVIRPTYKCDTCGAEEFGFTTTRVLGETNLNALAASSVVQRNMAEVKRGANSAIMPTGWASYYAPTSDRHECPSCRGDSPVAR